MELTPEEQREKAQYLRTHKIGKLLDDILQKLLLNQPSDPKEYLHINFFNGAAHSHPGQRSNSNPSVTMGVPRRGSLRRTSNDPNHQQQTNTITLQQPASLDGATDHRKSVRILIDSPSTNALEAPSPVEQPFGSPTANPKGRAARVRLERESFLNEYTKSKDKHSTQSNFQCHHIGTLATALSLFLNERRAIDSGMKTESNVDVKSREFLPWSVSIEDIFFSLRLPLYFLRQSKMTLSELYDLAAEFVAADFRLQGISETRCIHFDVHNKSGTNKEDDESSVVAHQSEFAMTVQGLRHLLTEEVTQGQSVRILHFDETEEINRTAMNEDTVFEMGLATPHHGPAMEITLDSAAHHVYNIEAEKSGGSSTRPFYVIPMSVNSVTYTASLAEVALTDYASVVATHDVRVKAAHQAMCVMDPYGERPRGFIEIARKKQNTLEELPGEMGKTSPMCMFDSKLLTGQGECGTYLSNVCREISSHLIASAYAFHLHTGKGIDIGDIVRTLSLPLQMVCESDMSILGVFDYLQEYIGLKNFEGYRVQQKSFSSTSNMMSEFVKPLNVMLASNVSPVNPNVVMMISFDVGIALNITTTKVRGRSNNHWAIVTGFDAVQDVVLVADVKPKKFKRMWKVATSVIFDAMVSSHGGYVMLSKDVEKSPLASSIAFPEDGRHRSSEAGLLSRMRSNVSRGHFVQTHADDAAYFNRFDYPNSAYSITTLAVVLQRLRYKNATVTDIATHSTYDMNYLLSDHLCMPDLVRVAKEYIKNQCESSIEVTMTFMEVDHQGDSMSQEEFVQHMLELYKEDIQPTATTATILHFSPETFSLSADTFGGHYGVVVNANGHFVTIMDANPQAYYRTWKVRWSDLYTSCSSMNLFNNRGRGFIRFVKHAIPNKTTISRPFSIGKSQSTHPFKPPLSTHIRAVAFALNELGVSQCSMEDVFYDAFGALRKEVLQLQSEATSADDDSGSSIVAQTHPWKLAKFKFVMVKNVVDVQVCIRLATTYLEKIQRAGDVKCQLVPCPSEAAFLEEVKKGSHPTSPYVLMVVYDAQAVHGLLRSCIGAGLIGGVDEVNQTVQVHDANPSKYGDVWYSSGSKLYRAIGGGSCGLLKIGRL